MTKALYFGASALAVLGAAWTAPAIAADVYMPAGAGGYKDGPAYVSWAGFYAGVNGGGAWSANSDQLACPTCDPPPFGGLSPSGGFGGGQIGYNWQGMWHPHLVLGIEADIQGAGINDKGIDAFHDVFTSRLDWFGTVRGRIGYATDSSLLYFTGGFAYGGIRNEVDFRPGFGPSSGDFVKNTTAAGYVLGGGWEYKFTPAWSTKIEYQYLNLGKNDPVDVVLGEGAFSKFGIVHDDAFHTVRVGLNYHFVPIYTPLK